MADPKAPDRRTKHGMFGTRIYRVWSEMVQRCTNPNNQHWGHYGGRGITVCDEWRDFGTFYRDVGDRPTPGHSLDRIDNDAGYGPSNCRWATKSEQNVNRRKKAGTSSRFMGVCWNKLKQRWFASTCINGKHKCLGYYRTEEAAAEGRKKRLAELARRQT